jgi:restriction system protein
VPVPTYDKFIEPILRYLAAHPEGAPARDVYDAAAKALKLSDSDRDEMLPSGAQAVYKNRAGWAHDRLKRAGYSDSPQRDFWQLNEKGIALAKKHRAGLPGALIEEIATAHDNVRLRDDVDVSDTSNTEPAAETAVASPDDRLEAALAELRESTRRELMDTLARVSPQFFEAIVLDVLHKLGYGTSRSDLQRVGRSGDGGIDDRLRGRRHHAPCARAQARYGLFRGGVVTSPRSARYTTFYGDSPTPRRCVRLGRAVLVADNEVASLAVTLLLVYHRLELQKEPGV